VAGDKGHSYKPVRRWLRRHHIKPVIPTRKDQRRDEGFEKEAYRRRNIVERAVGRFKWCRALATRHDKLAVNYTALWIIADIPYLLRTYPEVLAIRSPPDCQKRPSRGSTSGSDSGVPARAGTSETASPSIASAPGIGAPSSWSRPHSDSGAGAGRTPAVSQASNSAVDALTPLVSVPADGAERTAPGSRLDRPRSRPLSLSVICAVRAAFFVADLLGRLEDR
jgi:hypothetical protein